VVVGGTAGIGYATAELLVAEGARVAVLGRDLERSKASAHALSPGGSVVPLAADGRRPGELDAALALGVSRLGASTASQSPPVPSLPGVPS
jgi:3-oxoacyl-[acyl-carrier protein] reductase